MSTRSRIAMKTDDGYRSIYCHSDGYPEGVGVMLLAHYPLPALVARLIELGDLSRLGPVVGKKHPFESRDGSQCTYYGRDRGEKNVEPRDDLSLDALWETADYCGAEWLYVWDGDRWLFGPVPVGEPAALVVLSRGSIRLAASH